MPVQLPTTFGKAEYPVVDAIKRLAAAVDRLEARSERPPDLTAVRNELGMLRQRVDVLTQQVQSLLNP